MGASFADEADQLDTSQPFPSFRHLLVVFGGIEGLEVSIEADPVLGQRVPSSLFDHYIRPLEHCGSRTIRTEVSRAHSLDSMKLHLTCVDISLFFRKRSL